jgi:hypothetical protein
MSKPSGRAASGPTVVSVNVTVPATDTAKGWNALPPGSRVPVNVSVYTTGVGEKLYKSLTSPQADAATATATATATMINRRVTDTLIP